MSEGTVPCPHCGNPIQADAKFCPYCGQANVAVKVTYCPHCGSPVPAGATVCESCGQPVHAHAAAPQQAMPPQSYPAQNQAPAYQGQPQMYSQPAPATSSPGSGAATVSLVCGIISLVLPLVLGGFLITDIAGIVLGIVAIMQSSKAKKLGTSGGMQMGGLACGVIGICLNSLGLVACIACATAASSGLNAFNSYMQSYGY